MTMKKQAPKRSLLSDRRGIAATEFAMIAPALIFLVMGVLEMSFRFRASEEATRYVHQVADLVSREDELTTVQLGKIYGAAPFMMKPLETTENLDLDIASIGFEDDEPKYFWRRVAGEPIEFQLERATGMGLEGETVIRVGVRYTYESILSNLFGGKIMTIEREAFARPRVERVVTMDGENEDGGEITYFGPGQVSTS
ncbi:MAG TPA: TadE/TadG family type IV pilus assembly protein [Hyphomonadaceae bacterium]|nr:TadE/TadG family type IV pilus assembly protein [Hyphomonadaceae bacterium]